MIALPRAAYIPFRRETGYDPAVEMAAAFLERLGACSSAIVIVPQKGTLDYSGPLKQYARNRTILTPRNSNQSPIGLGHPALVYAPALKELELATRYTRDSPIAVVEDQFFSCARWADEIGAVNLVELRIHSTERSVAHQRILERIDFAGDSGWADAPGKRDLIRHLGELAEIDALDKDEILAYQLIRGRYRYSEFLARLGEEIDGFQHRS
ncbi:hypothetical protein [Nocardia xishanensis]|uniref:hypothetical protein n=1 Tax=Nocardia xishanensis TaxID=238964 RepID=UPI000ADE5549|nr:hypothetical protein [Nocardia xishanensis]